MRLQHLAVALAAGASSLAVANAATPTPIYAGGSSLSEPLLRSIGDCAGTPITGDTVNAACSATHPYSTYEYLVAAVGSGAGLDAFLAEASPTATPSATPYQDPTNGFTYPYSYWSFSTSDAPLDAVLDSTVASPATTLAQYSADGVTAKRGAPIQIPIVATPVTIPYNYKGFTNLAIKPSDPNQQAEITLNNDLLCFIWTQKLANGSAPASTAYDWSNAIFKAANAGASLFKKATSLPIVTYRRPDASGTTYLFTQWLSNHCKAYTAAGYSAPATNVTWPSFVTAAPTTGSGGMEAAVAAKEGAIGYVSPTSAEPVKPDTVPTAYLATVYAPTTFVESTALTVATAIDNASPPPAGSAPSAWGIPLNTALFDTAAKGAYPIVGLTYMDLYTCYLPTELTGVFDIVKYLDTSVGVNPAQVIEKADGFAPLPTAFRTAIINLLTVDSTKLIAVNAGQSKTQCPSFDGK